MVNYFARISRQPYSSTWMPSHILNHKKCRLLIITFANFEAKFHTISRNTHFSDFGEGIVLINYNLL